MQFTQDIQGLAHSLGLKKTGTEWHGPCPVCGGHDRFWLKPGRTKDVVMSCRQGCSFKELAKEMIDRGLAQKDDFKPKQKVYHKRDLDYCDLFIAIARGRHWKNFGFSEHDAKVARGMMATVDQPRREELVRLIEEKRFLSRKEG
jgi:hypothetical protein